MDDMIFREKIVAMLERRGLKQSGLARAMGVDPARITECKQGKWMPSLVQTLQMARYLGVSLDCLADDAQDEPPTPEVSPDERELVNLIRELGIRDARRRLLAIDRPQDRGDSPPATPQAPGRLEVVDGSAVPDPPAGPPTPARKGGG